MNQEPTTTDLMGAIVDLHGAMLMGFAGVDQRFDRLEGRVDALETQGASIRGEVSGLQCWMARHDARLDALKRNAR